MPSVLELSMQTAQPTGSHCPSRCPLIQKVSSMTSEFLMWQTIYTTRRSLLIRSATSSATNAVIAAHARAILCVNHLVPTHHTRAVTFTVTVQKASSGVVPAGTHLRMAKRTAIDSSTTSTTSVPQVRIGSSGRCTVCRRQWFRSCNPVQRPAHPSKMPLSTLIQAAMSTMGFVDYSAQMYLRSS